MQQRLALLQSQLIKTEAELERARASRNEAQGRVEAANTAKLRALERCAVIFFFGASRGRVILARTNLTPKLNPNRNSNLNRNLNSNLNPNLKPNLNSNLNPNLNSNLNPNLNPNLNSDLNSNLNPKPSPKL